MENRTVGFIGLGLIGGSIAKAIREFHPDTYMIAYTRNHDTLTEAVGDGTINKGCTSVDGSFADCDLIFLCAPVSTNAEYLKILKPIIKSTCIITDVGSTKKDIHEKVIEYGLEQHFIGGHPMAGSEKTGFSSSKRILIENAYYVITPTDKISPQEVDSFVSYIASLKAIPLALDYKQHDYVTAVVSHLPHLIASSLVNLVKNLDSKEEIMKRIAAGGFKDITRIASSSPEMWEQICTTNKENIVEVLSDYIDSLQEIRNQLDTEASGAIYDLFRESREYRNSIPDASAGPIKKTYAFYCDLVDETGGIAALATILATNGISIKNIGIIHNREFEEAVLKVELYDQEAYEKAVEILRRYRYTVYER